MNELYPLVEVSVVLIEDAKGRLLVDYNEPWSGFTFPMTKVRDLPASSPNSEAPVKETALAAALRAAAEVLGRPLLSDALTQLPVELPPYTQSNRDGQWKRYTFHLFTLTMHEPVRPLPHHVANWLTIAELQSLEPMSPTVGRILESLPD